MPSATPELIAAYQKALYVVFGRPELVIRIGEANPGGVATSAWKNEIANAALVQTQTEAGYRCFEGEGRDPQGRWKPERSALVVGISRADAEGVGRAFGQNAIVFVERGRAPELVVLGD